MFCTKCGKEIKDEFEFCPFCGQAIYKVDTTVNNEKSKVDFQKVILTVIGVAAAVIVVLLLVKLITKPKEVDITHGGEEGYFASSDFEWRFDYDWAEYDEEWDKISATSEIDVLADLLLEDDNLNDSLGDEIAKDYIKSRLKPVHYAKDTYWEFCPEKKVKYAEKMWQQYLKDHKELRGMYIVIRDKKYYPYADDDFDKDVFMNPYTATKVLSSSGTARTGEDYEVPEDGMGVIEYNPFDFVTVTFGGLSKRARAEINYTGSYLTVDDFEISQSDYLNNGDVVTVSVTDPDVAANYGCELLQTEETYEVEGLDECVEPENMTDEELAYLDAVICAKIASDDARLSLTGKETTLTLAASMAFTDPYSDSEPLNKLIYVYQEDFRCDAVLPHRYFYIVEVDEFVREAGSADAYHINDIRLRGSSFLPQSNGEISAVESADEVWNKYILPEFDKYEKEVSNYEILLFDGVPINSVTNINNDGKDSLVNFAKYYSQCYVERLRSKHSKWTITDTEPYESRLYRAEDGTSTVVTIMKFYVDNNASSASSRWAVEVYMPIVFEDVAYDDNACIMYSRCAGEDYALGVSHSFPHSDGDVRGYLTLEDMEKGLAKTFPPETRVD